MINKYSSFTISLMAVVALSGCGAREAYNDMKQTKADYQECLAENPKDHAACKHEKENYEKAGEDYNSLSPVK